MITSKNITKKQIKKLLKLLKRYTKSSAIARHGPIDDLSFAEAKVEAIKTLDEIRELLYDTSNLVKLGMRWGLFYEREDQKQAHKIKKNKKKGQTQGYLEVIKKMRK